MPDPTIVQRSEERHQDALARLPGIQDSLHCPPTVTPAQETRQILSPGNGTEPPVPTALTNTPDIQNPQSYPVLLGIRRRSRRFDPLPEDSANSPLSHNGMGNTEAQHNGPQISQPSRCPIVVDGPTEGAFDEETYDRHGETTEDQPQMPSENETLASAIEQIRSTQEASEEVISHVRSQIIPRTTNSIRSIPVNEPENNPSTRPNGASRAGARLGLIVPSDHTSHSQLQTPLHVRGPQSPNPATAIVANDPAKDASISPFSTDTGNCSPSPGPRPFGRYTPSFLYHGSVFKGTQRSDRQEYKVEVKIQHVDMEESFLCGFLKIEGLTEDHPTLETYFEGEIIGNKYTFTTRHSDWGATEKQDMLHWNRFAAWKPLARSARSPDFSYRNFAEREHIFMRWKEHFLVPDHNVKAISGASFEGFYYICFNQRYGAFTGIYYHSNSEKWQQLELKHEGNMGTMAAVEFR